MTWTDVVTGAGVLLAPLAALLAYPYTGPAGAICSAMSVAGVAWRLGQLEESSHE